MYIHMDAIFLWGFHKNMASKDWWAIKDYRPTEAKEKVVVVWNFKGEGGNSQGDGWKNKCLIKKNFC